MRHLLTWLAVLALLYAFEAGEAWTVAHYVGEAFTHLMEPLQCVFR